MERKEYDLLVLGGGFAGVGATIEAARAGLRVALIEKTILFGGLCTSGLVPIYMPLCDGRGRQVTFGIAEELLWRSLRYGPGGVPPRWAKSTATSGASPDLYPEGDLGGRFMTFYSPPALALSLDEALEETSADIWLDTLACSPVMDGACVVGVEVENKSGRVFISAPCVIDATGDADIAFRAGAPCRVRGSYPSLLYYATSLALAEEGVKKGTAEKVVTWKGGGAANEFDKGYSGSSPMTPGTRGKGVSSWIMESRRIARANLAKEQAALGSRGREQLYPAALPTQAQIRMSRCIEGEETVREEDRNRRRETSIGMGADCRKADAVWEIPFGALLPKGLENLLVAGRCISAEGYAWQVTRLVPPVVLTGQVAAIAARLARDRKTSPRRLDVADLQQAAESKGIPLHP